MYLNFGPEVHLESFCISGSETRSRFFLSQVFVDTKRGADHLCRELRYMQHNAAACGLYHVIALTCHRDADAPVNNAFYLDHRVDASEWLLHSRIRTCAYGSIAPLTHARRGVTVPEVLASLGPVELALGRPPPDAPE